MRDLTLLYYTSNRVDELFAENIRTHLRSVFSKDMPEVISISFKPMNFGINIHIPGLEPSIYNIYIQVLEGAKKAKTKFCACVEDDALYNLEHFQYRPQNAVAYNVNRWQVDDGFFFYRERINMCMCIAPTELIIKTLEQRFEKYPEVLPLEKLKKFGEPGRFEEHRGLPKVDMEIFRTKIPNLTFNHKPSVGGKRRLLSRDIVREEIPYWGNAKTLWDRTWNERY